MNLCELEQLEKEQDLYPGRKEKSDEARRRRGDALRFYMGGMTGQDTALDPMFGVQNARNTIDCILSAGVEKETESVKEGKNLVPDILDYAPSLLKMIKDLSCLFAASSMRGKCPERFVYRAEHVNGLESLLKRGLSTALTLTSKGCNLPDDLRGKDGTVLLRYHIPENFPYIDVEESLGKENTPANDNEVLLPPFLQLEIHREKGLFCGSVPVYNVEIAGFMGLPDSDHLNKEHRDRVCSPEILDKCKAVLHALADGQVPEEETLSEYLLWKNMLRKAAGHCFLKAERVFNTYQKCARIREQTDRRFQDGSLTEQELLEKRTTVLEKSADGISDVFLSDIICLMNRLLDLLNLEKEYFDYYPADLGHPEYLKSHTVGFVDFKDPGKVDINDLSTGEKIIVEVLTTDGDRTVWMPVELEIRKVQEKDGKVDNVQGCFSITGYTGDTILFFKDSRMDNLMLVKMKRNEYDPAWSVKRKVPDKRFTLRIKRCP